MCCIESKSENSELEVFSVVVVVMFSLFRGLFNYTFAFISHIVVANRKVSGFSTKQRTLLLVLLYRSFFQSLATSSVRKYCADFLGFFFATHPASSSLWLAVLRMAFSVRWTGSHYDVFNHVPALFGHVFALHAQVNFTIASPHRMTANAKAKRCFI